MSTSCSQPETTALVVGGGLVGTLCAAMLASRGWTVTLVESRSDPRKVTHGSARARSINLALSPRGIEALKSVSVELADRVIREGLPMRGRMLHTSDDGGRTKKLGQDYGFVEEGEVINSISRGQLGNYLLDHVDTLPSEGPGSVRVLYETKLLEMDLRREDGVSVTLGSKARGEEQLKFDLIIGGDGAYSRVRREMMRGSKTRFNYRQTYAPHAYLELSIMPGPNSSWSLEPNYLHIWPRGEFMLIALPNQDKSFTLTLFAHQTTFDSLDEQLAGPAAKATGDANPVVKLFRKEFPDALALMGEEALLQSWKENPKDGLITVECSPYHYKDRALLIGDSAHAMVPFYGQGMNCGFEDVRFLSSLLDHFSASPAPKANPSPLPYSSKASPLPTPLPPSASLSDRVALALHTYTQRRAPSLNAIQKLAAHNYDEMASSVLDPLYLLRLSLDTVLSSVFRVLSPGHSDNGQGGVWESLYRMTTFRWGLAYEEVLERRKWQQKVLERTMAGVGGIALLLAGTAGWVRWTGRGLRGW